MDLLSYWLGIKKGKAEGGGVEQPQENMFWFTTAQDLSKLHTVKLEGITLYRLYNKFITAEEFDGGLCVMTRKFDTGVNDGTFMPLIAGETIVSQDGMTSLAGSDVLVGIDESIAVEMGLHASDAGMYLAYEYTIGQHTEACAILVHW